MVLRRGIAVRVISGLLVAMAAFLIAHGQLSAGDAAERLLYGGAIGEGGLGYACFHRVYDAAHLRRHPRQKVTRMTAIAYLAQRPDGEENVVNIDVAFRKAGTVRQYSGVCRDGASGLDCALECDGGSFAIAARGGDAILLTIERRFEACDGDGDALFGDDDRAFRLVRTDMRACAGLIWEDAMRDRILGNAGVAGR